MALKRLRAAALLLLFLLVFTLSPASAFAEGKAETIVVEQCTADAPGYGLYFYPADAQGNLVYGLRFDDMQWTVKFGEKQFETRSLENVKEEGSTYIIMVNTSSAFTVSVGIRL